MKTDKNPTKKPTKNRQIPTKTDIKIFHTLKTDKTRHRFRCVGGHPSLKGIRRDESDVSESSGEEEEFDSSEDESDKESTDQSDGSSSDESDTASSSEEAGTSSEDESDDDTPLMASTPKRRRL